jgi:hypothetical protein
MNFQSGSQQPFALVFDFSALLGDNLNWNSCMLSSVAYLYLLNLNELVWQLYLVFNSPSVRPIYDSYRSRQPLRGFLAMLSLTNRLHLAVVYSVIDTQYDVICCKNKKVSTSHLVEWSPFVLTRYDVILCIYNQRRRDDVKERGGGRFSWKGTFELIYTKRCLQNIGSRTSPNHVFYLLDDMGVRGFSARRLCYSWSSMTGISCVFWSKFVKELQ